MIAFTLLMILGTYTVTQLTAEDSPPIPVAGHVDVFGLPVVTHTGLPTLKVVPQIECPNCSSRTLAASRYSLLYWYFFQALSQNPNPNPVQNPN